MNKEQFLAALHKEAICEEIWIEQLKKETLPLVMWGCGDVGDAVFDYLSSNNVSISAIWVDGADGKETYRNITIQDLSAIMQKYQKFNVILGHSNYEKGEKLYELSSQIQKVFYAFSIHYGQYELVPFASIEKESSRFVELCNQLADEASVQNLIAYLNTKMTGNVQYIFDVFKRSMNFYQNDVFVLSPEEIFLDIGAYNGDTIRLYLQATEGKYKKIIAMEPDESNYLALSRYIAQNRMKNVVTSLLGAWNQQKDLYFTTGKEQISSVCSAQIPPAVGTVTCYADRIDHIFDEEISFIKINYYEGVLEAIEGCENIIKKYHPKLAIDVGFDIYNVLLLFEYLSSLDIGYQFYLRFNRAMSSTFTMYVI